MSARKYIMESFAKEYSGKDPALWKHYKQKLVGWRKGSSFEVVEDPTNPVRARALGYKAKKGFLVVRAQVRRGGRRKKRHVSKRMPSKQGVLKFKPHKSIQLIAEERAARKFPNLEVLNSYWVGEDGMYKYFEVIFVDPKRPEIQNDGNVNWLLTHRRRVHRSLTSAGKKSRGLQ